MTAPLALLACELPPPLGMWQCLAVHLYGQTVSIDVRVPRDGPTFMHTVHFSSIRPIRVDSVNSTQFLEQRELFPSLGWSAHFASYVDQ